MNIDDLTLKQIREIQALIIGSAPESSHPLIGKNVIVRTITMIYTGRLEGVTSEDYILVDAAWIPETERFMQFVAEGKVRECEPYPDDVPVYIGKGAKLDMVELRANLPRSQK